MKISLPLPLQPISKMSHDIVLLVTSKPLTLYVFFIKSLCPTILNYFGDTNV